MITVWQAVVLGVVQGITEFFPVSSTAHLILFPWLLGWPDPGLTFDVALHAGTLVAVVGFFFLTWIRIIRAGLGAPIDVHSGARISGAALASQRRLLWFLVLATIPAGIIGLKFDRQIESTWRNPLVIAASLILIGIVMGIADRIPDRLDSGPGESLAGGHGAAVATMARRQVHKAKDYDQISLGESLLIGCAQAVAVIPGVSRSGATITAGLFAGLTREAAARFSFLLATPIIAGAVLDKAWAIHKTGLPANMHGPFIAGVVASAVVGLLAIGLFLRFLKLRTLRFFVWYRIALGLLVIGLFAAGFRRF